MKQKWSQTRAHYVDSNIGEVAYGGYNTGCINSLTLSILLCLERSVIVLTSVTLATLVRVLAIEVRECLLLFGAESFVFQFAIQKVIDQDM